MESRPSGTVTFLFADADSSSARPQIDGHNPDGDSTWTRTEPVLRRAIEANGGVLYKSLSNGLQAAFRTAPSALQAALDAQRALYEAQPAETSRPVSVRIALHTGVTEERAGDYFGPILNRISRVLTSGYGGQILLTRTTEELVHDQLPASVSLRDLGEHRLRDLTRAEQVFQVVTADLPSNFPPLKTLDNRPNNLPLQPTPLIGRQAEVAAVRSSLLSGDIRLLSLTGAGGIGKTRLALQVASELLDDFQDGVYFVPLGLITDPNLVVTVIVQTLGIRETTGEPITDTLSDYLRDKQLLLVLDNFEHVVAVAPVLGELMEGSALLKILATSRAALRLSMEHEYPVMPLSLPDREHLPALDQLPQYEAVALFVARAQAADPAFQITLENASTITEICYQLDGLPLALELAAARIKVMSPQQILPRLDSRLRLLTGGARDLPTRQQTLRATIDWSYYLLNDDEKRMFARLSVFARGSWLEGIEAVAPPSNEWAESDLLDTLGSLVDKNLLRQQEQANGEPRFSMLGTMREYGRERLAESGEEDDVRRMHAVYFLQLAEQAELGMPARDQAMWLERLELEHENLWEALKYSLEKRDAELGLKMGGALWRFWYIRGHYTEGHKWLADLLALPEGNKRTAVRAKALKGAGNLAYMRGRLQEAEALQQESLAISRELGDKGGMAGAYNNLGHLAWRRGDYATARPLLEQGLQLSREAGDRTLEALNHNNLGMVVYQEGDYPKARALLEEALDIFKALGDEWGIATCLNDLGNVVFEQGDYATARALYEQGLALQKKLGDKRGVARVLVYLGLIALNQSDYALARTLSAQGLEVFRELGDDRGISDALHNLGKADFRQGNFAAARAYFEESFALRQELNDVRAVADSRNNLGLVALAQGDYEYAEAQLEESLKLWREAGNQGNVPTSLNNLGLVAMLQGEYGRALKLLEESLELFRASGETLGVAFALLNMGLAFSGFEQHEKARDLYHQALNLFVDLGDRHHIATCLLRLAGLNAVTGEHERAARLGGAAEALFAALGSPVPPFESPYYRPAINGARAQLGRETFAAAFAAGQGMNMEQAVNYALGGR